MKLINWIKKNKLLSTVIVTVISEIISSIILSTINKINLWNATLLIWKTIYSTFRYLLLLKVSVWIILVILLLFTSIKIISNKIIRKSSDIDIPEYKKYIEDVYQGRKYSWDYLEVGNNICIDNLKNICPNCGGNLIEKSKIGNTYYGIEKLFCPNCQIIACDIPTKEEMEEAVVYIENKVSKILKKN